MFVRCSHPNVSPFSDIVSGFDHGVGHLVSITAPNKQ